MTEESREDIPLKNVEKSFSVLSLLKCHYWGKECFSGLGLIYVNFAVLSFTITFILCTQFYYGASELPPRGSISTDSETCSSIGKTVLKLGGNAVDAVIASTLCLAVVNPHTTGLSAGGALMIYDHRSRVLPQFIDFGPSVKLDTSQLPRLIIGLVYAHDQFGFLPWKDLVQPSVEVARNGFIVPQNLETAVELSNAFELFGHPKAGQNLSLPALASTLDIISSLTKEQIEYLVLITNEPARNSTLNATLKNFNIYIPNILNMGPILSSIVESLQSHNFTKEDTYKPEYTYRIAEIIQQTYIKLNISSRIYEHTAATAVATDMHDLYAVSVTGLNGMLGSLKMSPAGYLLDNEPANPAEMETTSIPVIITDKNFICGRRIVFGTGDPSVATQIISSLVIGNDSISTSVEESRFRILTTTEIGIEENHGPAFPPDILTYFKSLGNIIHLQEPYDSINIIEAYKDTYSSYSDTRGGGNTSDI